MAVSGAAATASGAPGVGWGVALAKKDAKSMAWLQMG